MLIVEFSDQPTIAHEETRGTTTFLEDDDHIARTKLAWQRLQAAALSPDDSTRLVAELAGKLRSTT